jgi:hypothetical protein
MKLQSKIAFTVLSVLLGVLAVWGIGSIKYNHTNWTYSGKAVFNTVQEYTQFKLAVGQMESQNVEKLQVLSSEPPIVAFFTVNVPPHTDFPYGNHDKLSDWGVGIFIGIIISAVILIPINSIVIWKT